MFQVSVPSALVVAALTLAILAGCAAPPKPKTITRTVTQECACAELLDWLQLQQEVAAMSIEAIMLRLEGFGQADSAERRFHFGLLNQQLDVFTNWAIARDAFRGLAADENLTWEQRRLAAILERYNQSRINWHEQYRRLEEVNELLEEEKKLLEQKIQAITDLETTISTRKEQ